MSKNKTIHELHVALVNNKLTFKELYEYQYSRSQKLISKGYNAIITDLSEKVLNKATEMQIDLEQNKNNPLFGMTASVKDNICTKGILSTGGSRFLQNYIPPFSATVVTKTLSSGALINNKSNLDEFGLGGTGTFSGLGIVYNPIDTTRISGGSSSGPAVCVATGISNFGIATDTGDSIRKPASNLGLVGFKPTYGLISRFGVMPYSPSLDTVGIIVNDVIDCSIVLDALAGYDPLDNTSIKDQQTNFYNDLTKLSHLKLMVFDDVMEGMNPSIEPKFDELFKFLGTKYEIIHVRFGRELLDLIEPIYMTISYAEAASSWNNLSGLLFGPKIDYENYEQRMVELRTNYLGNQLKKRFTIGKWFSSAENFVPIFEKSKRIRTCIVNRAEELLNQVDAILLPGAHDIAFKMEDVLSNKVSTNYCDDALQIANFGGYPSITIPFTKYNQNPIGLNIFGCRYDDKKVLNVAHTLENDIQEFNAMKGDIDD